MERSLEKGDVIVTKYPFTDLSNSKKRPALVITSLENNKDIIICAISSSKHNKNNIKLIDKDFERGKLNHASFINPEKLLTIDLGLISYKIGSLKKEKINFIIRKIINIIKN